MRAAWAVFLAGVVAVLGCVPPKDKAYYDAAGQLEAARQDAGKAGVLLSMTENRPPLAPEESNGQDILREAFDALKKAPEFDHRAAAKLLDKGTPESLAKFRAMIKPIEPIMWLAEQGLSRPVIQWSRNWGVPDPYSIRFPEYADIKTTTRLFAMRARMHAASGRADLASADLRLAAKIGDSPASDRTVIGALVIAGNRQILALNAAASLTSLPDDADFTADVEQIASMPPILYSEAIEYEAAAAVKILESGMTLKPEEFRMLMAAEGGSPPERPKNVAGDVIRDAFQTRVLQVWTEVTKIAQSNTDSRSQIRQLAELDRRIKSEKDETYGLVRLTMSDQARLLSALQRGSSAAAILRGLARAQAFRQKIGRLPSSLAEAGFSELDPFTGRPYAIKREGAAWKIVSPGHFPEVHATGEQAKVLSFGIAD